jgi:hypothetical protein
VFQVHFILQPLPVPHQDLTPASTCAVILAALHRSTADSFILQALPAHSLTQLSLLFEEELDEVLELLNVVTIPALAGLSRLQYLELHTSKGWDIDPLAPAVAALTALTRLHLHWLDDLRQLQHAPPQVNAVG